ncbi:OmpA/MotB family protein [Thiomicrorhabdus lithotrophica]|uniref:OmpA family protein n=1 Tax=Thiomicrorhabdus lithotrophica TaxID=2949997 RepID=A0ABY8CAV8_9GAMM|nr:OmpA family protein [Thiomicrorhabdus lithotrophica]WEJ63079.1 OmpA family protein [Thiomicrorhabdus lithotrophica]
MNIVLERAKSAWLLAFGDVITLLITFFIMTIVLNKGEISKIQKWVDQQVNETYQVLRTEIENKNLQVIKISRNANGVLLTIKSDKAFESGSFTPSVQLQSELAVIGNMLNKTPLLNIEQSQENKKIIKRAKEDGMQWYSEVVVEGHTDNDKINPLSRLRNNFFLSTLRAQSVMQTLYTVSDLPANFFSVAGYGEWQTVASNETEQGKQQNRRVEILLTASFQKSSY